ncbi:MAG: response regulator [Thermodesulfobacteriota bacterium]
MNILIVDDHKENSYLLESLLRGNGHNTKTAADGVEALEILGAVGIDLIISDVLMPVMDGFQLCRKVKTDDTLRGIPFIIYTATYTGPQDEAFAMKIGADRFIVKPCEPDVLMTAVNEVMAGAALRQADDFPEPVREEEVLKLYSERLVRKLEQKMLQAEQELQARQEAEKALRQSESRFRLFADTAPVGVVISDINQNAIYVSPKFTSLFGYTLNDIPTVETWFSLAYPDEALRNLVREKWTAAVTKARETQSEIVPMEFPVRCKDGTMREIEFRMSTNRDLDFIVFTDITERRKAETEQETLKNKLVQAQKLESVGRLAGGVAHDFNNMLNVILGYAELALNSTDENDPLYEDLKEIREAALRSSDITRQLLAFARRQLIVPRTIDLNEAVGNMLKILRRLIGEDIELTWKPGASIWPVKVDPSQVDQILANLCINARDAIAGIGRITIETGTESLNEEHYLVANADFVPGDYALLTVNDDGPGMDRNTLEHIFEPFFTTKEDGQGTGLGLATVFGIVRQNDGFIDVDSAPGRGTTFKIYLPRQEGVTDNLDLKTMSEIQRGRGETVLVVEDEIAVLKLTRKMLTGLGYEVLTAATPLAALTLAREHQKRIDLLMTDVVMPQMNGRTLAEHLRNLYPAIRILFMSGYTADVISRRGVLDEGVQFIQKPFSKKDLAMKVREALDE